MKESDMHSVLQRYKDCLLAVWSIGSALRMKRTKMNSMWGSGKDYWRKDTEYGKISIGA